MQYFLECLLILYEGFSYLQPRMEFEICKKAPRSRVRHFVP
ncbi:hypothetical protein ACJIZ3_013922 [Penstemon smallii]|uniref:Ribosomal protein L16 n=1 Tax=Penstemon smallii TaxID=265156 RepID=A0ABD3RIT2_9LAMI